MFHALREVGMCALLALLVLYVFFLPVVGAYHLLVVAVGKGC